jgi:formate hydrogenlyase subunit 4
LHLAILGFSTTVLAGHFARSFPSVFGGSIFVLVLAIVAVLIGFALLSVGKHQAKFGYVRRGQIVGAVSPALMMVILLLVGLGIGLFSGG